MKKYPLILTFALLCISIEGSAQATGTASTTAEIIAPISITNAANMNLGTLATGTTLGTVVLAVDGTRTSTGGVTLSSTGTAAAAASFTVAGDANATYSVSLPTSVTLSDGATNTMTAGTFVSNPATTGTLDAAGSSTLNIGATLNVGANQVAAVYTNAADLAVTVNYN
jgi:hypothetical protein